MVLFRPISRRTPIHSSPPDRAGAPFRGRRSIRRGLGALSIVLLASFATEPARAQILERATVFQNARILDGRGRELEQGMIIVKGGKVVAMGRDLKVPALSRKVDLEGKTVTPGFVDVWSGLAMRDGAAQSRATLRAEDGFDRYAEAEIREAWQQGVTTVYVAPRGRLGIAGQGAVVRLVPGNDGGIGKVHRSGAALAIDLGSGSSVIARARRFQQVRDQFSAALRHRQALEEFEEALEDYEKELAEYIEKNGDDLPDDDKKKKAAPEATPAPPSPGPEPRRRRRRRPDRSPEPTPAETGSGASAVFAMQDPGEGKKKKAEEKPKPPTAPRQPSPRPDYDVLLSTIGGELPVRIRAELSSDLLNALALIEEFDLSAVLEGATEGYLVADQIAEREVPVILGDQAPSERRTGWSRRAVIDNGARMRSSGVEVYVGSGGNRSDARFAPFNAQLAQGNRAISSAMDQLTSKASELLSERELGALSRGRPADMVVWSGSPMDPASQVEAVYVGGKRVYSKSKGDRR